MNLQASWDTDAQDLLRFGPDEPALPARTAQPRPFPLPRRRSGAHRAGRAEVLPELVRFLSPPPPMNGPNHPRSRPRNPLQPVRLRPGGDGAAIRGALILRSGDPSMQLFISRRRGAMQLLHMASLLLAGLLFFGG